MASDCDVSDVLIIGGGPAGLSAAINAASEGLRVRVLDSGHTLGGQARESNAIENYLGFPDGVTGDVLMSSAVQQARKFDNVTFVCPVQAVELKRDEVNNRLIVITEDYQEYVARTVIIAIGLSYRRLDASNLGPFMGRGVYYGAPPIALRDDRPCAIAIIGGANSAGQAAVKLAENKQATVHMYVRKTLDLQMSDYLIKRLHSLDNVTICEHCEIVEAIGTDWLGGVKYKVTGTTELTMVDVPMDYMFIFIGAQPRTRWLVGTIQLDENRYIKTGGGVTPPPVEHAPRALKGGSVHHKDGNPKNNRLTNLQWIDDDKDADFSGPRTPMHYESSMPGVFVAGDVRAYSTKRIAAAIGEGSAVVAQIHLYLANTK